MSHDAVDPRQDTSGRLTFLGGPLPPSFALRVVVIEAGAVCAYDPTEWRQAIVIVEHGTVELEWPAGGRCRVGRGDVLHLDRLGLHRLRNPGPQPAVLAAVTRSAAADGSIQT